MRRLSSFAWRSLLARRARTVLTTAGIALGVGVLFAALVTNAGIEGSAHRTALAIAGRSDLRISALGGATLSAGTMSQIASTPGVSVASPELQVRTFLQQPLSAPGGGYGDPVTVLGVDPAAYARLHDLAMAAGKTLAAGDDASILISERLSAATGVGVGDRLTLLGSAGPGPTSFTVTGIMSGDGPLPGTDGRMVMLEIGAVRTLFEEDGATREDVAAAPGTSVAALTPALEGRLTGQPYVLSTPAELEASLSSTAADFQAMTALIAAIALFAGAFLIFNTLSMTVTERVREVGLLRAAGTTRRQVNGLILEQAAVLGLAGSIAGIAVGLVIAYVMAQLVVNLEGIPLDRVDVGPDAIAVALAVGLGVTLAAAVEPAWRAGRISPVEALRARVDPSAGLRARLRWLAVVFVAIALAGFVAWPKDGPGSGLARFLAVYVVLLVGTLLTPFLLGPLGRLAGIPFGLVFPAEERLTRGALVRDRSRTALTLGALTVGLAMVVAMGAVALNARTSAAAWLAAVIPGDEVVTSIRPAALDEHLQDQLAAVDGVARVSPVASFEVAKDGTRADVAAIVGADFLADGRLTFVAGDRTAALRGLDLGGSVVLPDALAQRFGVGVGDAITLLGGSGDRTDLRVVGIVERSLPGRTGEAMLVGWPDATRSLGVRGADFFAVRFAPGRAAQAQPALDTAARGLALLPSSLADVEGAIGGALGRVFGLFDALAVVAVIMAGLGIANTLSMNVLERVREIGVLRAIGMTRRQVARMVVVEAGVLGLVGAFLGCLLGIAAGATLLVFGGAGSLAAFEVPWSTVAVAAALGVLVAMVAAYQPARLAGRAAIIQTVQFE